MKKILPLMILMSILISCNKKENIPPTNQNTVSEKSPASLHLESFGFPEEIGGCSCYFAVNADDFEAGKYIFADDMGKNTYLKIDGKILRIPKTDDSMDPEKFSKHIENERFDITLKGHKANGDQEAMIIEGTINVKDQKSGAVYNSPFYGECGC